MEPSYVAIAVGIAQIVSILGGGGLVAYRLGRTTQRMESSIDLQKQLSLQNGEEIRELKSEVKALNALMTEVALQKVAIERLEQWYDELRRGEGFVYPLTRHLKSPAS